MKTYYYIGDMGHIHSTEAEEHELSYKLRKIMGNYFETYLEAEAYVDYLLAKEVIKEDAKGFKPDWDNGWQKKHYGCYNIMDNTLGGDVEYTQKKSTIYFQSEDDLQASFKKHRKEWKTYLTYKQQ